jgi:hypothetical protein
MDTGNKTSKSLQQTYDADLELALALSASVTDATDDEYGRQQHLIHLKLQEEADAEYARQLADEFAFAGAQAGASASASNTESNDAETNGAETNGAETNGAETNDAETNGVGIGVGGDDMDAVLEEIARMEAEERLKATGHAYNGKTNINGILANEDEEEARIREKVKREEVKREEEARIREKVKREAEMREWRAERARQDAEYAAVEENDRLRELSKKVIETSIPAPAPAPELLDESEPEPEPIPLTKEDLRRARLAFFTANQKKS